MVKVFIGLFLQNSSSLIVIFLDHGHAVVCMSCRAQLGRGKNICVSLLAVLATIT